MNNDLLLFAHDLQTQILATENGSHYDNESKFTQIFIDYLADEGIIDEGQECSYKAQGLQINGYGINEDEGRVDLFVTKYTGAIPPQTIPKNEVEAHIRRVASFYVKAVRGLHNRLTDDEDARDLAKSLYELGSNSLQVNIFLLTDGVVTNSVSEIVNGEMATSYNIHIWDLERLYRNLTSGQSREEITLNFGGAGGGIPCLSMPEANDDYVSYLCIIPGAVLADIYGEYGTRLLERNVRSFLQARGSINKGIRKTIKTEPHMFLAYNNGISAVAEEVEVASTSNNGLVIRSIKGLQIVNGGQTTASIYHTYKRDKVTLNGLSVQAKITVVVNKSRTDEMVSNISLYANSQNKVQTADFSSNDPFHRGIEQLSRTIWAPTGYHQTKWYYERARGQYLDDRGKEPTLSFKKEFDAVYPKKQKFTKLDLARYENLWNQMPYFVCRGGQKNFREYTLWRSKNDLSSEPDANFFRDVAAKAILYREIERIVSEQKFGGYRSQTVAYVMSFLSYATNQGIDLVEIWNQQSISHALATAIVQTAPIIRDHIANAPRNGNVTEWCKKRECWDACKEVEIKLWQTY